MLIVCVGITPWHIQSRHWVKSSSISSEKGHHERFGGRIFHLRVIQINLTNSIENNWKAWCKTSSKLHKFREWKLSHVIGICERLFDNFIFMSSIKRCLVADLTELDESHSTKILTMSESSEIAHVHSQGLFLHKAAFKAVNKFNLLHLIQSLTRIIKHKESTRLSQRFTSFSQTVTARCPYSE